VPTSPNELRSALRLPGVPPACAGALPPPELESLAFRGCTAGPCRLRRMNCTVAPRPGVPPAAAGALPLPRCPPGYTASHADSPVELRSTTGPPGVPPAFAGALRPSAAPPRLHRRPAPTRREGSKSVLVLHSLSPCLVSSPRSCNAPMQTRDVRTKPAKLWLYLRRAPAKPGFLRAPHDARPHTRSWKVTVFVANNLPRRVPSSAERRAQREHRRLS